jgi:hypothetical protein
MRIDDAVEQQRQDSGLCTVSIRLVFNRRAAAWLCMESVNLSARCDVMAAPNVAAYSTLQSNLISDFQYLMHMFVCFSNCDSQLLYA